MVTVLLYIKMYSYGLMWTLLILPYMYYDIKFLAVNWPLLLPFTFYMHLLTFNYIFCLFIQIILKFSIQMFYVKVYLYYLSVNFMWKCHKAVRLHINNKNLCEFSYKCNMSCRTFVIPESFSMQEWPIKNNLLSILSADEGLVWSLLRWTKGQSVMLLANVISIKLIEMDVAQTQPYRQSWNLGEE